MNISDYWAEERRYYKRDLKAGYVAMGGGPEQYLRDTWNDKVGYRSDEIKPGATFSDFKDFVLYEAPKKASKKVATNHKKKALKKVITKHESLLAKLKRKWRSL